MSKMSTLYALILERVNHGELPVDIADALDIPVTWVYEATEMAEEYSQYTTNNSWPIIVDPLQ